MKSMLGIELCYAICMPVMRTYISNSSGIVDLLARIANVLCDEQIRVRVKQQLGFDPIESFLVDKRQKYDLGILCVLFSWCCDMCCLLGVIDI